MYPFSPVFLILSTEKSFKMFRRHNKIALVSESFALSSLISTPLTNK